MSAGRPADQRGGGAAEPPRRAPTFAPLPRRADRPPALAAHAAIAARRRLPPCDATDAARGRGCAAAGPARAGRLAAAAGREPHPHPARPGPAAGLNRLGPAARPGPRPPCGPTSVGRCEPPARPRVRSVPASAGTHLAGAEPLRGGRRRQRAVSGGARSARRCRGAHWQSECGVPTHRTRRDRGPAVGGGSGAPTATPPLFARRRRPARTAPVSPLPRSREPAPLTEPVRPAGSSAFADGPGAAGTAGQRFSIFWARLSGSDAGDCVAGPPARDSEADPGPAPPHCKG
jgi:hypothetical protein